ncbi:MAG: glycosyltransferase family 39 protein [Xanthomonadaceae bacterium]|nr:glycosyltransferase family 39 protein [Xanthomonadaceae bacterium]
MTAISAQPAWRQHARILIWIVLWLAATAWMRPLMHPDEGRYATVAWEMVRSGDWLTPTLNGMPFFHKPPLFYWITAMALYVWGPVEFAARVASLAGASLAAFSLYLFTRRWSGEAAARRVLWVLLVLPMFFAAAQFANLDMLVAGCITATVLALAHAALCYEQGLPYRGVLRAAYVLAALGILSKGLIGFVLPAMIVGLWLVVRWRWKTLLALVSVSGLVLFLLVAAPWFVAMQQRFDGFLHYFFVVQHFQRFAATGFNNVQPWWFYPAVLLLCSLPLALWLKPLFARGYFTAPGVQGAVRLLMGLTVFCVVLFFSLPKSKLLGYILPAVPALAWLIADACGIGQAGPARLRRWNLSLGISALIGLTAVIGLSINQSHSSKPIGVALRAHYQQGQPVFILKDYLYAVPFYARLQQPVHDVDDWSDPDIARRDTWRKEIADAGSFAPALARQLLIYPQALPHALCSAEVSWVLGAEDAAQTYPFLARARVVYAGNRQRLWQVDTRVTAQAAALGCRAGAAPAPVAMR